MKNKTLCLLFLLFSIPSLADSITPINWGTGFYTATLNGTPIQMVCIDALRQGPPLGVTYEATVSRFDDLSATRRPDLALNYTAAAYLYDQMLAHPDSAGQIQSAMWSLLTPSVGITSPWAIQALSLAPTFNTSQFVVITPTGNASSQEMIARLAPTAVPEPATLLLLGAGLAALSTRLKKKG